MVARSLLSGCITLALSACVSTEPSEQDELQLNRERWEARRADTYEFAFRRSCECTPLATTPMRITVEEGRIRSVVDQRTGEDITSEQHFALGIEELFATIEDALNRRADQVSVRYHRDLGYPKSIAIDYIRQRADDEVFFTVDEVRAIR